MAKLIYVANVSLDGYIEDAHGRFEWTAPTDEVFTFTDLVRPVGAYLYGRRMYETMAVWEADPTLAAQSELRADFADRCVGPRAIDRFRERGLSGGPTTTTPAEGLSTGWLRRLTTWPHAWSERGRH